MFYFHLNFKNLNPIKFLSFEYIHLENKKNDVLNHMQENNYKYDILLVATIKRKKYSNNDISSRFMVWIRKTNGFK